MGENSHSQQLYSTHYVLFLSLISLILIIALGAISSATILHLIQVFFPALYEKAQAIGLDRITRRFYLLYAVIFLLIFLKKAGWNGIKDIGWRTKKNFPEEYLPPATYLLLLGISIGIIAMCALLSISIITRTHVFDDDWMQRIISQRILKIFLSGIIVGIFEETLCRGIFFRVLARRWNFVYSAILTSLIFALAHFATPSLEAFAQNNVAQKATSIFFSTLHSLMPNIRLVTHIVNLTLLGVVFALTVKLTGTIWFAAGTHISAVWIIKSFSFFTTYDPAGLKNIFQSSRTDMMDSISATILLALLIGILIMLIRRKNRKETVNVYLAPYTWHIIEKYRETTIDWIKKHFKNGTTPITQGTLLKEYKGCRVVLKEGIVLKEYYPTSFLKMFRLSFKKARVSKAFAVSSILNKNGIPVAKALGWCVVRNLGFIKKQYLLVKEIANASSLDSVLIKYSKDPEKRAKLLEDYGKLMALFHKNNFSNRDMKYENIICTDDGVNVNLWVVDLDGVSKKLYLTRYRAGRDLRRVGLSLSSIGFANKEDISSFFRGYNSLLPPRLHRNSFPFQRAS